MNQNKQIRFTENEIENITKYAECKGITFSEAVRQLCKRGLELEVSEENIGLVADIIDKRLRSILAPQIDRLASISAKSAITSATSMYLNAQALVDFVPKEKQKEFLEVYEKARLKGVAYVKKRTADIEDLKKED